MSDQIKMPNLKTIGLTLAGITASITFAAQALAGNRTMGVFNASDNPAKIECGNGSHEELPSQVGTNCGDGKFPNQFIIINNKIFRYDKNLSSHFRIENGGITRGN